MPLKLFYRDVDRTPLLYTIKSAAHDRGVELDVALAPGREYPELLQHGEADLLAENYYNLQTFRARGMPLVSLATSVSVAMSALGSSTRLIGSSTSS